MEAGEAEVGGPTAYTGVSPLHRESPEHEEAIPEESE